MTCKPKDIRHNIYLCTNNQHGEFFNTCQADILRPLSKVSSLRTRPPDSSDVRGLVLKGNGRLTIAMFSIAGTCQRCPNSIHTLIIVDTKPFFEKSGDKGDTFHRLLHFKSGWRSFRGSGASRENTCESWSRSLKTEVVHSMPCTNKKPDDLECARTSKHKVH